MSDQISSEQSPLQEYRKGLIERFELMRIVAHDAMEQARGELENQIARNSFDSALEQTREKIRKHSNIKIGFNIDVEGKVNELEWIPLSDVLKLFEV